METLYLPNLEQRTLARFDELARKEKIFYEEAVSELITVDGFEVSRLFNFLISITLMRVLIKKQLLHATLKPL
jgi:ATP adenylyltransferase